MSLHRCLFLFFEAAQKMISSTHIYPSSQFLAFAPSCCCSSCMTQISGLVNDTVQACCKKENLKLSFYPRIKLSFVYTLKNVIRRRFFTTLQNLIHCFHRYKNDMRSLLKQLAAVRKFCQRWFSLSMKAWP